MCIEAQRLLSTVFALHRLEQGFQNAETITSIAYFVLPESQHFHYINHSLSPTIRIQSGCTRGTSSSQENQSASST
jgi:hypothetical protein